MMNCQGHEIFASETECSHTEQTETTWWNYTDHNVKGAPTLTLCNGHAAMVTERRMTYTDHTDFSKETLAEYGLTLI